jgi:hypothetical protein
MDLSTKPSNPSAHQEFDVETIHDWCHVISLVQFIACSNYSICLTCHAGQETVMESVEKTISDCSQCQWIFPLSPFFVSYLRLTRLTDIYYTRSHKCQGPPSTAYIRVLKVAH